jgi:transcription elongation factor Elf1
MCSGVQPDLKLYQNRCILYIIFIGIIDGKPTFKYGRTENLSKRMQSHARTFKNNINIWFFRVNSGLETENTFKEYILKNAIGTTYTVKKTNMLDGKEYDEMYTEIFTTKPNLSIIQILIDINATIIKNGSITEQEAILEKLHERCAMLEHINEELLKNQRSGTAVQARKAHKDNIKISIQQYATMPSASSEAAVQANKDNIQISVQQSTMPSEPDESSPKAKRTKVKNRTSIKISDHPDDSPLQWVCPECNISKFVNEFVVKRKKYYQTRCNACEYKRRKLIRSASESKQNSDTSSSDATTSDDMKTNTVAAATATSKLCRTCHSEKLTTDFYTLHTECKECYKKHRRDAYQVKNPTRHDRIKQNRILLADGKKICSKCEKTLDLDKYYRSSNLKSGYASMCKSCCDG